MIVGPDDAPWITDSGLNAIVCVDPKTDEVRVFPAPEGTPNINLNTATFDNNGILWFTGQTGYYGRLNPANGEMKVFKAPHGRGPYGIATAPTAACITHLLPVHISRASTSRAAKPPLSKPPTRDQGARRVWADSKGGIWVSEWFAGKLALYDPATQKWREWPLPGDKPRTSTTRTSSGYPTSAPMR